MPPRPNIIRGGGAGDDSLVGSDFATRCGIDNDSPTGPGTNDVLVGGAGEDVLDIAHAVRAYGGEDADLFALGGDSGRKRIFNFDPATTGCALTPAACRYPLRRSDRLDDVRVRSELAGGTVAQNVLLVGADDTTGIAVEIV